MQTLLETARQGKPLDVKVIDAHCHMGVYHAFYIPDPSAEGMLRVMDRVGIDQACITPHLASCGSDYRAGNSEVIETLKKYPDRFLGYCTINPNYPREIREELKRCFAVRGFMGIKLHPFCHGVNIEYKGYEPVYEFAHEHKLPILFHTTGESDIRFIEHLAETYTDANYIMGHAGFGVRAQEYAMEAVNRHTNIFVDIAISFTYECNVEWMVESVGSEKVLYGSDMPFFDPRPAVGRVALADLSDEAKQNIFYHNIYGLIKHLNI